MKHNLTPEQIEKLANEKLASIKAEAADHACLNAWNKTMTLSVIAGAGLVVTAPIGGMAGLVGVAAWVGMGAAIPIAGLVMANRTGQSLYDGDPEALMAWLPEENLAEFAQKAEAVRERCAELKKPVGVTPEEMATTQTPQSQATPSTESKPPLAPGPTEPALLPIAPCALDEAAPHLLMLGRTREGKSETLKHLIGGEERVWYVTSKFTDKVPEHWKAYRVGGRDLPDQMEWLLSKWEAQIDRHLSGQDREREWFVVDEAVGIIKSLSTKGETKADRDRNQAIAGKLKGLIVELVTAGAAVNAFVGLLSQTGNSGPLGIDLDLLKNFSVVSCGKRKKAQMITNFCKMTQLKLTPEQEAQVLGLPGFWQLWENDGATLSQVPLSPLPLLEVQDCPINDYQAIQQAPAAEQSTDWESIGHQLLAFEGESLRKAAGQLLGKEKLGGQAWIDWRDELKENLKILPVDLQDALVQKYSNVLL